VSLPGRKRRSRLSGKSLAGQSILRDCTYVFDIAFISGEAPYVGAGGWSGSWALIVLGEFKEHFVAPTGSWRPTDYETQWLDGAHRLIDGARESCFVAEAGRLWWTAWREGARILVQQRLLVADSMAPGRNATAANLRTSSSGLGEHIRTTTNRSPNGLSRSAIWLRSSIGGLVHRPANGRCSHRAAGRSR
jgi:hypothetical protein